MGRRFQLIDRDHPIYRPFWVRLFIVVLTLIWTIFEFLYGEPFWGVIVGAVCLLSVYEFFMRGPSHASADACDTGEENSGDRDTGS